MTTKDSLDLGQLSEYEIIGEFAGHDGAKVLLATRRADHRPVTINVLREPSGDEGNALSHLAADTNLLAGATHPHIVPVLEGRWLGNDAFAMVSERASSPTLEEMLARREEDFPYARVASILRDINAALEWARDRKVVHRSVRLDNVYVEPGSDHVRVSFAPAALSASGAPGADEDARTIAVLARAMLTRSVMAPERENVALAELRPGLPARVVEQTDALMSAESGPAALPDIQGYIASIAMAEELKRAEVERETVRLEMEEEQRRIRGELAAEREAHDRDLAEQAKRFSAERERERESMTKEREGAARALARERKDMEELLAKERERMDEELAKATSELAKERERMGHDLAKAKAALAKDRERTEKELAKAMSELEKERRVIARDRERLNRDRDQHQREIAKSREKLAAQLAGLQAQASLYDKTSELPVARNADLPGEEIEATPLVDHVRDAPAEPHDEIEEPHDEIEEPYDEIIESDVDTVAPSHEPEAQRSSVATPIAEFGAPASPAAAAALAAWPRLRERGGRAWRTAGMALLVLMVLAGASVVALSRRGDRAARTNDRAGGGGVELQVVDSIAGGLAAPVLNVDTAPLVAPPISPSPARRRRVPVTEEPSSPATTFEVVPNQAPAPPVDSMPRSPVVVQPDTVTRLPFSRPDSTRPDSAMRSRLDSLRLVLPKLDSVLPRRDTMPARERG